MHETTKKIISLFKKVGSELSTSQILKDIDEEYSKLTEKLSLREDAETKRKIAQMHRRTLHHLNKLVGLNILTVVKHGEKGEKFFTLNVREDEEISEISPRFKRRVIISRPILPLMPIEGYEQKGLVAKYEPATWIDRLNSVIVFSEKIKSADRMHDMLIENLFPVVNDTICLENFEALINEQDVSSFLERINAECEEYGKQISLSIVLSELKNRENFLRILNLLSTNRLGCIDLIFSLNTHDLEEYFSLFSRIIEVFAKRKIMLYIKNKAIQNSPYFTGRAGPYCFIDKEWQFAEELRKGIVCLGCSQSSVIVDVNKFYGEYGLDIEKFSQLMLNISKSTLSANAMQRRKSEDYFRTVNCLNKDHEADFLSLSRNYIRFWNFGLSQPGMNPEFVLNMINEAKKKIDEFAAAEETIYKSCGITTRFRIALSCAFATSSQLSPAKYSSLEIKDFDDLYKKEIKKEIIAREVIGEIFNGGNEVTFHYTGILNPESIIRQISIVLSTYKIPLFNYNFENIKGDMKLTSFIS